MPKWTEDRSLVQLVKLLAGAMTVTVILAAIAVHLARSGSTLHP